MTEREKAESENLWVYSSFSSDAAGRGQGREKGDAGGRIGGGRTGKAELPERAVVVHPRRSTGDEKKYPVRTFFMEDGRIVLGGRKSSFPGVDCFYDELGRIAAMKRRDRERTGDFLFSSVLVVLTVILASLFAILVFDMDTRGNIVLRSATREHRMPAETGKTGDAAGGIFTDREGLRERLASYVSTLALMAETGRNPDAAKAAQAILSSPETTSVFLHEAEKARKEGKGYTETITSAMEGSFNAIKKLVEEEKASQKKKNPYSGESASSVPPSFSVPEGGAGGVPFASPKGEVFGDDISPSFTDRE